MNLRQLTPYGSDPFCDLPCTYGRKRVPRRPYLAESAVCYVELGPHAETKSSPTELCHFHRRLTELYVITGGNGLIRLNQIDCPVKSGCVAVIPPYVCHTAIAGAAGLEFLVVTVPPYDPADSFDVFDLSNVDLAFSDSWLRRWSLPAGGHRAVVEEVIDDGNYGLHWASLPGGWRIPTHRHSESEEFYFVLAGTASVEVGEMRAEISRGTIVALPKNVPHALSAGVGGAGYLIFASPRITGVNRPIRPDVFLTERLDCHEFARRDGARYGWQ